MNAPTTGRFFKEAVEVTTVHSNLSQEIVKITVDRLKLILQEHAENMEAKSGWGTPLGILITMLIVFPTTEFKEFLGLKAEVWQAGFIIAAVLTFAWLGRTIIDAIRSPSVGDVIEKIKSGG